MILLRIAGYAVLFWIILILDHAIVPALFGSTVVSFFLIALSLMVFFVRRQTCAILSLAFLFFESLYSPYPFVVHALAVGSLSILLLLSRKIIAGEASLLPVLGLVFFSPFCYLLLREMWDFVYQWLSESQALTWITLPELQRTAQISIANTLAAAVALGVVKMLRHRLERRFLWRRETL